MGSLWMTCSTSLVTQSVFWDIVRIYISSNVNNYSPSTPSGPRWGIGWEGPRSTIGRCESTEQKRRVWCLRSEWLSPQKSPSAGVVLYTHLPSAVSSCVRWRSKGLSYRVSNALAHHAQQRWQTLQATDAEELLLPASPLFMKRYGRGQKQWAKSLCAGLSLSLGLSSTFTDLLPLLEAPWFAFFPHWTSWGWDESCLPDFLTVQEKGCPMWAHHVSGFYIFTTVYL